MTAPLPWFKAWPQRWLNATRELTLEERGAYNDLLQLLYLRDRRIPDDAQFCASFLGITKRKWNAIRDVLLDHDRLVLIGDYLTDERFEEERAASRDKREAQAAKGRKGGKARAEQAARDSQGRFDLNECENGSNPPTRPRPLSGRDQQNAETATKTQQNQRSAPDHCLDALDDSFLRANDVSNDFREDFDEISRDFSASKNSENGSFPPPSSRPSRARTSRATEVRDIDSNVRVPFVDRGSGGKMTKRAAQLAKDWQPEPLANGCAEIVAQWPEGMHQREVDKFRDHAAAKGRTLKDWNAGWRNWIRKADDDWQHKRTRSEGRQGWSAVGSRIAGPQH